ncbi:hypothetical protein CGMCC3_g1330 [Colletotrichum fructicola]|nr:uncharacterized protein CGMCC3_g1330 [Colletotrichum fructicola]KAE9582167.1 hypothetical protein CGMCC3_g1330 [Colletotrichum fructicola]
MATQGGREGGTARRNEEGKQNGGPSLATAAKPRSVSPRPFLSLEPDPSWVIVPTFFWRLTVALCLRE